MRTRLKTALGLLLTGIMLFPVYWMLNVSLTRDQDMRKSPPDLFPSHVTLEGYRAVVDQQLPYLGTSLVIGLGTVALTVALAAPAGYALAKLRPRGGGVMSFVLLAAQMIPGIIMAMGFYAIYLQLGLLQTGPGLIVADSTLAVPFAVLIFTAFMSGIPGELLQAAKTDGAGPLRTFWSVVLPMSRNAVVTVSLFARRKGIAALRLAQQQRRLGVGRVRRRLFRCWRLDRLDRFGVSFHWTTRLVK